MSNQLESLASILFWLFPDNNFPAKRFGHWATVKISLPTSQSARVISEADNKLSELIYDFQAIGIYYEIVQANEITGSGAVYEPFPDRPNI